MLLWGAFWGCLCLLLCLGRLRQAPRLLGKAALVCALRMSLMVAPTWYWWAKLLGLKPQIEWLIPLCPPGFSLLWLSVVVYGLQWVNPVEVGLRGPQAGSGQVVGVVAAVAATMVLNAYIMRQRFFMPEQSEQLFLATLPGLVEEVFYRGVLLGLLGRVFARRLPLPGTYTSWGGVVSVVLFALAHGLKSQAALMALRPANNLHVSLQGWYYWLPVWRGSVGDQLYYLALGALFLWVRERTGSVWAAAGTHCLMNSNLLLGSRLG